MIRAVILACAVALPAHAQQMTPESCRAGWEALNILIEEDARMIAAEPDITADGLCRIDRSNAPLQQNDFESAEWRATGVEEAAAEQGVPLSLTAVFTGIDLTEGLKLPLGPAYAGQTGTMQIDFARDAETRAVALHDWTADFGPLGRFTFTGKGGGVDLRSLKTMQFTSGGLRVYELSLDVNTTGALSKAVFPQMPVEAVQSIVGELPAQTISEKSRTALQSFLQAGPGAEGRLSLVARSEAGVGLLQMVGGVKAMEETGPRADGVAKGLGILLEGVTIEASWMSGR